MIRSLEVTEDSNLFAHKTYRYGGAQVWGVYFKHEQNNCPEVLWYFSTEEKAENIIKKIKNFSLGSLENSILIEDKSLYFSTYLLFILSLACFISWLTFS